MKIIRLLIWCLLCTMAAFAAQAENFYIENYEVALQVSKERKVHVKEAITVRFTAPVHGINRDIPTANGEITNIDVSEPFSRFYNNGTLRLRIGDANQLVSGQKVYQIEYNHQLYSNKNEFYYNLIGTGWDVPINKVRFYVKMPDKVEDSKVGLSIGSYGTRGFEGGAEFSVKGAEIWGQTFRTLAPYEGMTLRAEVSDGYFIDATSGRANLVWLGLLLCTLFSFLTWYQYGKDEHVTPVVTFNPPEDINSAEAELVMNEKITERGLISLIIKLADEGCFKIRSEKKKFMLCDFKEYNGNNKIERSLFNLLKKQVTDWGITDDELKVSNSFYSGWRNLCRDATGYADRKRFYEKSSMNPLRNFMMFLYIIGTILLTVFTLFNYHFSSTFFSALMPIGVMIIFMLVLVFTPKLSSKICFMLFLIPMLLAFGAQFYEEMMPGNLSQAVMGAACIISTIVCYVQMLKPNIEGRLLKGRLLGLKHFIKVAEKKKLEMMVEQNPQYFYKILPYAYILGVSKV